ncbi:AlpA family transcriptional regulator [Cellulomonas sp. KRMCY2]|uniref:helix-turn-helix transcriptional regulator n=1 Tax=Cellulomonas sp. KRMCY2 TaxID=1304865 RepID=UPI00045E9F82|nr:helix-turn-helix domain-containing protein [Cellulomonas sp. KRMCY2]
MSTTTLLSPLDASEALGVSVQTLANWRSSGRGPAYCRVGERVIRYAVEDLAAFVAVGRITPGVAA